MCIMFQLLLMPDEAAAVCLRIPFLFQTYPLENERFSCFLGASHLIHTAIVYVYISYMFHTKNYFICSTDIERDKDMKK